MSKSFADKFEIEEEKSTFWNLNRKIIAFLLVLVSGVVIVTTGCTKNGADNSSSDDDVTVEIQAEEPNSDVVSNVTVGNDGVKAGLASDAATTIEDDSKMVSIFMENTGRPDPFFPESDNITERNKAKVSNLPFELLPPTESLGSNSAVAKVLTTKVSGIMYDNYSPSAILNIDGVDYLVRSGDTISDYKVLAISKNIVTIKSGPNVYKAGVGQLLTADSFNEGNIANLENKFGSSKNKSY